jgi:DNA-binding transcriptional LysR family regulator
LDEALGRIRRPQRGALVVSCSPSLATEWLMPHLQDFYRECPHIELLVRAEMTAPSAKWMEAERIDVLIDYLHAEAPGLHQLACLQELTFPVCSRAYRSRLDSLPVEERAVVLMHDDAAWREGETAGAEWQEWMSSSACGDAFVVKGERHFNLAYLAYQAAVYGQGVAIGRSISVNRLLHFGDLVAAADMPPVPSAYYRVFSLTPPAPDSAAERFSAWIARAFARTQQDSLDLLWERSRRPAI